MGNGSRSRRREEARLASGNDGDVLVEGQEGEQDEDASAAAQHKAHKARQRRRKNEKKHDAVAVILANLLPPSPADANLAASASLSPPALIDLASFTPLEEVPAWHGALSPELIIDWPTMGDACDPASMIHDGEELAMASEANTADLTATATVSLRAMRKRWQVSPKS
jgi:hypothetical protein